MDLASSLDAALEEEAGEELRCHSVLEMVGIIVQGSSMGFDVGVAGGWRCM